MTFLLISFYGYLVQASRTSWNLYVNSSYFYLYKLIKHYFEMCNSSQSARIDLQCISPCFYIYLSMSLYLEDRFWDVGFGFMRAERSGERWRGCNTIVSLTLKLLLSTNYEEVQDFRSNASLQQSHCQNSSDLRKWNIYSIVATSAYVI
jgi:hypothetical protein